MKNNSDMNIYKNIYCRQIFRTVVLLLLFVCSIQSTWADEVIYSLTDKIGSAEATAYDATVAEGVSLKLSNTTGRIKITPKAGRKFQNGDIIRFSGTIGNTAKNYGVKIFGPDGTTLLENLYVPGTTSPLEVKDVLKLSADADYIYIGRSDGTGTTLTSCEIIRPTQEIKLSSTPASSLSAGPTYYIDANGIYLETAPESYIATYKCTAIGETHGNEGTTITIPNATEGKYTVVLGGCSENKGTYKISSNNGAFIFSPLYNK